MDKSSLQETLDKMKSHWKSSIVAREQVGVFSGGILTPKYLANRDSLGLGPKGRIKIGKKVAYDLDALLDWMEARAQRLN